MADFFGLDLADEVLKQIAEKGNVKTVKEELMKDPKVQTLAKLLTKNGDLLFYRKGILHNMLCVEFYIETPIVLKIYEHSFILKENYELTKLKTVEVSSFVGQGS